MSNFFSYLNSPDEAPLHGAPCITQHDDPGAEDTVAAAEETFDETAEAGLAGHGGSGTGEWIFPDPVQLPGGDGHQTPLDHLAAAAANASPLRPQG